MATVKIQTTKNYRLFERSAGNRPTDVGKHKKLVQSMERYGFLKSFPIVCSRDDRGRLVVKDGQHRLLIAESLGLPVYWVEEAVDFDIAVINCTGRVWALRDYAATHAANGKKDYQVGLDFAKDHGLPVGTAFSLLAGCTGFTNLQSAFVAGDFRVKDRKWADAVAAVFVPLVALSPAVRNARFIEACMAVCRVPGFDPKRLAAGAEKCRHKLGSYSTRDAYLDVLEHLYNWKRSNLVALKIEAQKAMRARNPSSGKKKARDDDEERAA